VLKSSGFPHSKRSAVDSRQSRLIQDIQSKLLMLTCRKIGINCGYGKMPRMKCSCSIREDSLQEWLNGDFVLSCSVGTIVNCEEQCVEYPVAGRCRSYRCVWMSVPDVNELDHVSLQIFHSTYGQEGLMGKR
jgi:hypothetical protein